MRKIIQSSCVLLVMALAIAAAPAHSQTGGSTAGMPQITPEELVKILQAAAGNKPAIFQVGFHVLYAQAHIPGAAYVGPASTESGLQNLQKQVESLPRDKFIVLYCGCCPWIHCPNVKPAYEQLRAKGFTNVKVLYIADNFGANWVDKGYPVAKGD